MSAYTSYQNGELVAFLRKGDQLAFTELYNRYFDEVYTYCLSYIKDPATTEDLVHEVFIKLWEVREQLQIHASFEAYLFRICHNKAINTLRRFRTEDKLAQAALYHLKALATPIAGSPELEKYDRLLDEALESLPPQRRRVFILCRQEGKSYEQVAAELNISRHTVKEHMAQALKDLRQFLVKKGGFSYAIFVFQLFS